MTSPVGRHDDVFEIAAVTIAQLRCQWKRNGFFCLNFSVGTYVLSYFSNAVIILMDGIIRQFIIDPQTNEDGNGHTGGQTNNIDEGVGLVLYEVAKGDFDMVSEHDGEYITGWALYYQKDADQLYY
jgi:hypothetical protein